MTVKGKFVKVCECEEVYSKGKEKNLKKQEIALADGDSTILGVLWESQVNVSVSLEKSYLFKDARVAQYREAKYLSFPESAVFEPIDDIADVVEFEEDEEVTGLSQAVVVGEIVEVSKVERYTSCRGCSSKVTKRTELTGECSRCETRVKLSKCPVTLTARIVVENDTGTAYPLTAFGNVIADLIDEMEGEDVEEKLLNMPKIKYFLALRML